jgi:hypothetical protein
LIDYAIHPQSIPVLRWQEHSKQEKRWATSSWRLSTDAEVNARTKQAIAPGQKPHIEGLFSVFIWLKNYEEGQMPAIPLG